MVKTLQVFCGGRGAVRGGEQASVCHWRACASADAVSRSPPGTTPGGRRGAGRRRQAGEKPAGMALTCAPSKRTVFPGHRPRAFFVACQADPPASVAPDGDASAPQVSACRVSRCGVHGRPGASMEYPRFATPQDRTTPARRRPPQSPELTGPPLVDGARIYRKIVRMQGLIAIFFPSPRGKSRRSRGWARAPRAPLSPRCGGRQAAQC